MVGLPEIMEDPRIITKIALAESCGKKEEDVEEDVLKTKK